MRELQEGKYTAPSGTEIAFQWETTSRDTELKTGTYTFPAREGARVQHQGRGAMTFPLACIFTGENCMEEASAFEEVLYERGIGELQHPVYGTFKVKPTGNISRTDDPVTKAGESIVTITFTETIDDEDGDEMAEVAADSVDERYEEFSEAAAGDFAESIASVDTIGEQLAVEAALEAQSQSIIDSLQPLAMADESLGGTSNKKTFADWLASAKELKDSVKNLYDKGTAIVGKVENTYVKALNIARLTLRLMKLPARLATTLASKIQGYASLTATLVNQYKNDPFDLKKIAAAYTTARLGIEGAIASIASGAAISTAEAAASRSASPAAATGAPTSGGAGSIGGSMGESVPGGGGGSIGGPGADGGPSRNTGVSSREEAVETANRLMALLENMIAFEDSKVSQDAFVDAAPESYIALVELVYQSARLIMNALFSLPMQRTITLDRDRQVVELCAELYGSPDYLDDFIIQNNFNLNEIELLPMGTKVTHYVQSA
jgi:prophage DNA circulation protein